MTQTALAEAAGVSRRWLSDLEAGKATAEVGLVLNTLHALDLIVDLTPSESLAQDIDLDQILRDLRADRGKDE